MIASAILELWLLPIGLLAGGLGGMLGIGGSILMIPAMMIILGPDLHVYQGAAMIVNFFVSVPAMLQHIRRGAVLRGVIRVTIPAATATVLLGVWLSESRWFRGENELWLSRLFGAFLWYEVLFNLRYVLASSKHASVGQESAVMPRLSAWRAAVGVGVPTGFVAGLLGVGGGIVAVPLQQLMLKMPLRSAIANSSATIVCLSVVGAVFKGISLAQHGVAIARPLGLAAVLIPTAVIGGYWGARLTHRVPLRALRLCMIVLMAYAGWKLIVRESRPGAAQAQPAAVTVLPAQDLRGPSARGPAEPAIARPPSSE